MIQKTLSFLSVILVLIISTTYLSAAKVDTVSIASQKMEKSFKAILVLPDPYGESELPVVYLLHGWSGDYRNWFDKADLPSLADHFQMIIVCPDGGYSGWYLDSPLIKESQYESYIVLDVVDYIDQNYKTISAEQGRAICGLSMGGHGAISLLECGIADRFIETNRRTHRKLIDLNIAHDYYERPGGHSWDYWVNALPYHLLYFKTYFKRE